MVQQQVTDAVTTTQQTFPTEIIDLPSKGLFYPEGSPLRSGQIELKYMTAKEEDILTSTNLIQKGTVLDVLMDSLIVTKGVKSADLLIGDLNAVMIASRILGYGKDYPINVTCPSCNASIEQIVDLTTLVTENEPESFSPEKFVITLPLSNAQVEVRLLTRKDELDIEKEVKSLKKLNNKYDGEGTARLRSIIKSVNGDSSKTTIWNFVETLLVRDAKHLRNEYKKIVPNIDFKIQIDCDCNMDDKSVRLPIGSKFFWPDA